MVLERPTIEGESPVDKMDISCWLGFLSTIGHGKSGGNLGGPSSKAKYKPQTDSAQVPRGKDEKNP